MTGDRMARRRRRALGAVRPLDLIHTNKVPNPHGCSLSGRLGTPQKTMTNPKKRAYTLAQSGGVLTVTLTLEGVQVGGGEAPDTPEDRAFLVEFAEAWVGDEGAADGW